METIAHGIVGVSLGRFCYQQGYLSSSPHPYPAIPTMSERARRSRSFIGLVRGRSSSRFFYTSLSTLSSRVAEREDYIRNW